MIEFFRSWCENIIVAVIICIIIEAILPEGSNKKYVKVVIGIYIIFTILNPILGKLDTDFKFENKFASKEIQTSSMNTEDVKLLYVNGIKETLKNNIQQEFGYIINNIEIVYDKNYENIENINLVISSNNINKIEKIQIGNNTEKQVTRNDYSELIEYISKNYELDKNKIQVRDGDAP